MESPQKESGSYLENIALVLLGIAFILFPVIFTTLTTDAFALPKQVLLGIVVFISIILFAIKSIKKGEIKLRRTPFDLAIVLFGASAVLSSLLSIHRGDSLIALVPFVISLLSYFVIVNLTRVQTSFYFLSLSFVIGASLVSILAVLSFLKIYILPFAFTQVQFFSPFNSLLDQALYLAFVGPSAFFFARPLFARNLAGELRQNSKNPAQNILFAVSTLVILVALVVTVYQLVTTRRPTLLPYDVGFQTAMAQISQDTGRIFQGAISGSGFGTYSTVFSRFKQATFNLNPTLWPLTFFRSSSFVLEILATMGILGLASFLYLALKIIRALRATKANAFLFSLALLLLAAFLLPFSNAIYSTFFIVLSLFAAQEGLQSREEFYDVELSFVARKKGVFALPPGTPQGVTRAFPILIFLLLGGLLLLLTYYSTQFVLSDLKLQASLVAAAKNDGTRTYQLQNEAIRDFPYRDGAYRLFSQTNLALADSLANQIPQGSSPSAQTQQTILTLIQQSINAGRTAVALSPRSSLNWQNLSSIYRALIGFGRNAENFAIITSQQAIALDPNNPQLYINLGGIFYQLQQWDEAQRQFQIAVSLKPDFANAYYNLGHALEQKGDSELALVQYRTVQNLLAQANAAEENKKKIKEEIDALQTQIGGQVSSPSAQNVPSQPSPNQPPLGISAPSAQLPEQKPPVEIPAPASPSGARR